MSATAITIQVCFKLLLLSNSDLPLCYLKTVYHRTAHKSTFLTVHHGWKRTVAVFWLSLPVLSVWWFPTPNTLNGNWTGRGISTIAENVSLTFYGGKQKIIKRSCWTKISKTVLYGWSLQTLTSRSLSTISAKNAPVIKRQIRTPEPPCLASIRDFIAYSHSLNEYRF